MSVGFGWKSKREVPELRLLSLDARADQPREFRILKSEILIGSEEDCQFVVRRPSVSRRHASVAFRKDHYEICDLGSTNGSFVNGRRITGPTAIELGDQVRVGDAAFVVTKPEAGVALPSAQTAVKRVFTLRGAVEAVLLAFAVGFGAAQYLAYLFYHEQNRLILAEAVPINQGRQTSTPASAKTPNQSSGQPPTHVQAHPAPTSQTHPASTPEMVARASQPPPSKISNTEEIDGKEFGGGVALAQLISGSGTQAGRMAPDFDLPGLEGGISSLSNLRGKVVLLNFWATWCGACRSEMPSLEGLYRDYRSNRDLAFVTVSVSGKGAAPVVQFMQKNRYDFPVFLDDSNTTSSAYGVSGIPSTFVIGRDGKIIWNCVGAIDWSNHVLREALKKVL